MIIAVIGVRELLERHLWRYYGAQLSSIGCRSEWRDFVIKHRNSMDVYLRNAADAVFPVHFNGVCFQEFQEAVEIHKGQIDDLAIVEVLEELVSNKEDGRCCN